MLDHLADIHEDIATYYSQKLVEHGDSPRGVDWNSLESQVVRFEQLLKVCDGKSSFSLNDFGCGYGALLDHMNCKGIDARYCGFDISETMIAKAKERNPNREASREIAFVHSEANLLPADFTVASGIFNVRSAETDQVWMEYILATLAKIRRVSSQGFAFNILTSYSDPEKRRDDLYYADPTFFFDYCKRTFSKQVALLHDYGLYEFTILVKLEADKTT